MKNFIHKTNTYLLENHPALWNTKIVWMLGASLIIHIIFYLFGMGSFTNPETLHDRNAIDIFYRNGMVFFSVMVSIILLVGWLIFMFKNNAFKNFYPTNTLGIFKHFILYFIIILTSITFYYSYMAGVKTFISITYQDKEMAQDIAFANKAAPFFSHGISNYTLANVNYPEPLNTLYCEVRPENIDYEKTYYTFLDKEYQFYDLRTETIKIGNSYQNNANRFSLFSERTDSTITYYFKNKAQDISPYIKTIEPSYYNYSKLFYSSKISSYDSYKNYNSYNDNYYHIDKINKGKFNKKEELFLINKAHYNLLETKSAIAIKAILNNFLECSKKYKIKHNLDPDIWLGLIYNPNDFKLKHIINDEERNIQYNHLEYKENLTPFEKLHQELITDYFIETDNLGIAFENIEELKTKPLVGSEIHFFLWISFILTTLIFVFRIAGLKPLLFSIISSGILMIFVALVAALVNYTAFNGQGFEYFMLYFILAIGTTILLVALFFITKIKKSIAAIFMNITLAGFVPYILLIFGIITMHQSDTCRVLYSDYRVRKESCFILLETLAPGLWSYILLAIGFIFVFLFSKQILNWKAMPEG
ncbi:hypothetical protein [Lacinutrix chionoecetis]